MVTNEELAVEVLRRVKDFAHEDFRSHGESRSSGQVLELFFQAMERISCSINPSRLAWYLAVAYNTDEVIEWIEKKLEEIC